MLAAIQKDKAFDIDVFGGSFSAEQFRRFVEEKLHLPPNYNRHVYLEKWLQLAKPNVIAVFTAALKNGETDLEARNKF